MRTTTRTLVLRTSILIALSGFVLLVLRPADASSGPEIGPYTEIQLPLEDLPALPEDQVYNPVVELTSGEPIRRPSYLSYDEPLSDNHSLDALATAVAYSPNVVIAGRPQEELTQPYLQVLYVLEDPREVPLARYAYNSEAGVVLPVDDMEQLAGQNLKTINVYVKVQNFSSQPVNDPLLASEFADTSWPALYVSPLNIELEGISQFPCAAVEYADGTDPYALPAGIDGGGGVGEDGLYNPASYAPPKPWYYGEESALQPGESREGWVSCLAPDVPLEQLQVKAKYRYMREPGVVTFNPYSPASGWFPDHERLASIGLTLADFPATIEDCEAMDYCVTSCAQAKESGVEQGLCGYTTILHASTGEREHIFHGFRTEFFTEPTQYSYLAWTYTSISSFPTSFITIDDILLTFYGNQFMEDITTYGTVTLFNPRIEGSFGEVPLDLDSWSGSDGPFPTRQTIIYTFLSRVKVEPYSITVEEMRGYHRMGIGVSVRAYIERDDDLITAGANIYSLDVVQGYDPDTGTFAGVTYGELGEGRVPTAEEDTKPPLLPNTALLNIYSNYAEETYPEIKPGIYPVNVVTMYQPDSAFVSKTNMCDAVNCIEYFDEDDEYRHFAKSEDVPKPSRTIPVMCAGEWANNVIVDDLQVAKYVEYIGEPWGLGIQVPKYFKEYNNPDQYTHTFFYDLQIMGGATPWWNVIDRGRYQNLFGETVDLYAGQPTYDRVNIIGYYSLINQADISSGYFVPAAGFEHDFRGWMGGKIDQKVLVFNRIGTSEEFGEHIKSYKSFTADDAGFLFLQEGPIWNTSCQRDILPALSDQEVYAPLEVSWSENAEEEPHDMSSLLPGMRYPLSLPYVGGRIFSLGEYGDTYPDNNLRFTVKAVEMIPGKPDKPTVYVPGEGKFYPADESVTRNNKLFFRNNNAFVIPPDTTYIRVKIGVDYKGSRIGEDPRCQINDRDDFQLIYPGYLPITGSAESTDQLLKEAPCLGEDHTFWISYRFPSLDFELENMMISVHSIEQRPWNFWRLAEE